MSKKWRMLLLLALAELLGMAVWFSASAVMPTLTVEWALNEGQQAWLTMAVQVGFVTGALASAVLTLPDRVKGGRLFTASAALAGLSTLLIPLVGQSVELAMVLRFLTGVFLAGVYPVGMKIMATWTRKDRGLGIGLLVGALTVGSAAPHLVKAFGGVTAWQYVLYGAGGLALLGSMIALAFIEEGPYAAPAAPFDLRLAGRVLRNREVMLANAGYLGHMWELYAMWTWVPVFLTVSFQRNGASPQAASLVAFGVIAIGGLGSLLAGRLADRIGRTTVATVSLMMSGSIALIVGLFLAAPPLVVSALTLMWGFVVVADSAQFSACVSELCDKRIVGTALTLQTSMGFLLTLLTIRFIPTLERLVGWEGAFAFLALGPLVGIIAMQALRRTEKAALLAGGRG